MIHFLTAYLGKKKKEILINLEKRSQTFFINTLKKKSTEIGYIILSFPEAGATVQDGRAPPLPTDRAPTWPVAVAGRGWYGPQATITGGGGSGAVRLAVIVGYFPGILTLLVYLIALCGSL